MINVAMLWLINEQGKLLLARRADHLEKDPGLWGPSVTGTVEPGETFEQALAREAEEELALKASSYTYNFLFETDSAHPDGETRRFKVYIANVTSSIIEQLTIDTNAVAEVRWASVPDTKSLLASEPVSPISASAALLWKQIFEAIEDSNAETSTRP